MPAGAAHVGDAVFSFEPNDLFGFAGVRMTGPDITWAAVHDFIR